MVEKRPWNRQLRIWFRRWQKLALIDGRLCVTWGSVGGTVSIRPWRWWNPREWFPSLRTRDGELPHG